MRTDQQGQTQQPVSVQRSVATNSVPVEGFGNTLPVASNENSAGQQQNRRVELVVSGEAIGATAEYGLSGNIQKVSSSAQRHRWIGEIFVHDASPFNPRNPQQQGTTGQSKDDLAR